MEFMVDKGALGQVYLRLLRLSVVSYHSTNASHTFINRQSGVVEGTLSSRAGAIQRASYSPHSKTKNTTKIHLYKSYILFTIKKNYIRCFSA